LKRALLAIAGSAVSAHVEVVSLGLRRAGQTTEDRLLLKHDGLRAELRQLVGRREPSRSTADHDEAPVRGAHRAAPRERSGHPSRCGAIHTNRYLDRLVTRWRRSPGLWYTGTLIEGIGASSLIRVRTARIEERHVHTGR
jgi:hypothetical protein